MNAWPCGTPKSTNNAFSIPKPAEPTKAEISKAKERARRMAEYDAKLLALGKTRKSVSTAKVLRQNKNSHLGAFCGSTNSQKAPR